MNEKVAIRDDGVVAVLTHAIDDWGYGYLLDVDGSRIDWPVPLAGLLGQGSWKPLNDFGFSQLAPQQEMDDFGGVFEKAYQRRFGTKREAAQFAARARWGSRRIKEHLGNFRAGKRITINGGELGAILSGANAEKIDADLSLVHISGHKIFDGENLGLARDEMPQVPRKDQAEFLREMRSQNIAVTPESVDPKTLKPAQKEILASRSGMLYDKLKDGSYENTGAGRLLVSSDGFVIDGHHRWAALVADSFDNPRRKTKIVRVDLPASKLIPIAHDFGERMDIGRLSLIDPPADGEKG